MKKKSTLKKAYNQQQGKFFNLQLIKTLKAARRG